MACHFARRRPPSLDPELFEQILFAIDHRVRLSICYWSASRDEMTTRLVDPLHLASVSGQWYLIGFCHLRSDIRMFVPRRIRSIATTVRPLRVPSELSYRRILEDCVRRLSRRPERTFTVSAFASRARPCVLSASASGTESDDQCHRRRARSFWAEVSHLLEVQQFALVGVTAARSGPASSSARCVAEILNRAAGSYLIIGRQDGKRLHLDNARTPIAATSIAAVRLGEPCP